MVNANQVIVNGKTILDLRSDTVTPETLQKGYTAHDKSGTKIIGTLEASSPGAAKETWVIKDNAPVDENSYELAKTDISFASGGTKFVAFEIYTDDVVIWLKYYTSANSAIEVSSFEPGMEDKFYWQNNAYKKLTFDTPPTGALLTWLQSNATKQPDDTAIQDTKALTITSNGTVSVTPDAPYDALKKVDVTVDVASGGGGVGFKVTFPATATNWDKIDAIPSGLILSDGTVKPIHVYSDISGQTVENVIGIACCGTSNLYVLRMTLSEGVMAQYLARPSLPPVVAITTAPNTTVAPYGGGTNTFWWPLADTVISAIEMYNTD